MSARKPWLDWTVDEWAAYRRQVAAWLAAHDDRPNTVMRRCLAMADRRLARLGGDQ